jgi:hypothetical protein
MGVEELDTDLVVEAGMGRMKKSSSFDCDRADPTDRRVARLCQAAQVRSRCAAQAAEQGRETTNARPRQECLAPSISAETAHERE